LEVYVSLPARTELRVHAEPADHWAPSEEYVLAQHDPQAKTAVISNGLLTVNLADEEFSVRLGRFKAKDAPTLVAGLSLHPWKWARRPTKERVVTPDGDIQIADDSDLVSVTTALEHGRPEIRIQRRFFGCRCEGR